MESNTIVLQLEAFSSKQVYDLLQEESSYFSPPLCESLDLNAYATKLSEKAHFLVCRKQDSIVGLCAFYKNDVLHQIYITHLCIHKEVQHQGLGKKLIEFLANSFRLNYDSIGLEVSKSNVKAKAFYDKLGFKVEECRETKFLMKKNNK